MAQPALTSNDPVKSDKSQQMRQKTSCRRNVRGKTKYLCIVLCLFVCFPNQQNKNMRTVTPTEEEQII